MKQTQSTQQKTMPAATEMSFLYFLKQCFSIKQIYYGLSRSELVIFFVLFIITISLFGIALLNPVHYPLINFHCFYPVIFFPLHIFIVGTLGRFRVDNTNKTVKRLFAIISVFVITLITIILSNCALGILLLTPFSPIDHQLLFIDRFMGFHLTHFMSWTYRHPPFLHFMAFCYNSWEKQLIFAPIIAALFIPYTHVLRYILCLLFSFSVASLIYFFFPTTSPVSVLNSPHFLTLQHTIANRFYDYHHHLVNNLPINGLISFPSCHVIGATAVTLLFWRHWKWFIPVAIFNAFLCVSTLALGFHYLVDVIAAFAITFPAFYYANIITATMNTAQPT